MPIRTAVLRIHKNVDEQTVHLSVVYLRGGIGGIFLVHEVIILDLDAGTGPRSKTTARMTTTTATAGVGDLERLAPGADPCGVLRVKNIPQAWDRKSSRRRCRTGPG